MRLKVGLFVALSGSLIAAAPEPGAPVHAVTSAKPWLNPKLSPDQRASLVLREMTQDEKLTLVYGYFGTEFAPKKYTPPPGVRDGSAGYIPGIARLGLPPQWQTDAGIGVATQGAAPVKRERTALPSGIATAATWNPDLAFRGGAMIGKEARASGFNVMLAGGVNLLRDPRNGRNFEYGGEDPLLAGTMVGAQIRGIQSNRIISTVKHFALNDQETQRHRIDVVIDPDQARMSDLLAFQIAIEQGDPGSVMCAYNRVGRDYACENGFLLTDVLRRDWKWKGYVMSDWGAVHSTAKSANAGLDQQSGAPFDDKPYFAALLKDALAQGKVSPARLDEMAFRILRTMFEKGLVDHPVTSAPIDFAAHALVTRQDAEEGMVLLRNERNLLPLSRSNQRIAVIGGYADRGVLTGGGSSLVYPRGGNAVPGLKPATWPGPIVYYPDSPMGHIKARAGNDRVSFADGTDIDAAVRLARESDVAVVFVTQWATEDLDLALRLDGKQDSLVEAVARANPNTIVVLETGGPVLMPWLDKTAAVLQAWYPGTSGGEAIARILFGEVNPSGRLPATFPRDESQLARPKLVEAGPDGPEARYREGAAVGYKYYDANGLKPLFAFGHGLSYTKFDYERLTVAERQGRLVVRFRVRNTGSRPGMDVPQVYVSSDQRGWEAPKRLGGWRKVALAPGKAADVQVEIDPRLVASYRHDQGGWRIAAGAYTVQLGASATDLRLAAHIRLSERNLGAGNRPCTATAHKC